MNQNRSTTLEERDPLPDVQIKFVVREGPENLPAAAGPESGCKVAQSIAYMTVHINKPLQVATLAAMANVSPSHFFALFKKRTGCPPMDYFTRLRMRQACRLLDSTTASVKEVAAALGYDDPFYFSRVFKSVTQVPPSRYRNSRGWPDESREDSRLLATDGARE